MSKWNIYYNSKKINNTVLTDKDKEKIQKQTVIYKKSNLANNRRKMIQIPVKDIKFVKTYVF
jgi:hypothetical protein